VALLDWCASSGVAAIPFGGGSSVVGGVEADVGDAYPGVPSLDLTRLDRVVEIDRTSRAARIQAGAQMEGRREPGPSRDPCVARHEGLRHLHRMR
jgi:FAD/FMN-containing dehydrogenase